MTEGAKEVDWEVLKELAKQTWTRQQRRAYHRVLSGLRKHKGERLRFLTLTSAEGMERPLNEYFRILKERIKRLTPLKLLKAGYVKKDEIEKYYPNKPLNEPIRFDYFKVETSEGVKGVLHILYFGDYIPQKWLKHVWKEITGHAHVVDIRACKDRVHSPRRLARYIIAQYVAGQTAFVRFSWSWNWVAKGFVKVWEFIKNYMKNINKSLDIWNKLLDGFTVRLGGHVLTPDMRILRIDQSRLD